MKNRKKHKAPLTVLGIGLSGVPLLPVCASVFTLIGGADLSEAELAAGVGFFLSLGWLGVCSVIAFMFLVGEHYE